jgi:hypothetical protein
LRGKGSNFKEGPLNTEIEEPLHLWVSSKSYENFNVACSLIEDLLLAIFRDYKTHCIKNNLRVPSN